MKLSDHQFEFLKDFARLILYAAENGIKVTAGELYRLQMMQDHYFKTGVSKTKRGNHPKRLAGDLNVFVDVDGDGDLDYTTKYEHVKKLGDFWESLNPLNRWGGDWNGNNIKDENFVDTPHFERNI